MPNPHPYNDGGIVTMELREKILRPMPAWVFSPYNGSLASNLAYAAAQNAKQAIAPGSQPDSGSADDAYVLVRFPG